MTVSITLEGTEEVVANVNRALQEVPELVFGELVGYADQILQASEPQVPWKTMHLEETGTVEPVDDDPNAVQIVYDTPYATKQHEDLTLRHPKPGTKAKYLEDPAMAIAPEIVPGIVEKMQEYFDTGIPDVNALSARSRLGNESRDVT